MNQKSPEEIIAKIVSSLIRVRRFSVEVEETGPRYKVIIKTISNNQGRVLGQQAKHLKDMQILMSAIDENIHVVLDDPDESVDNNNIEIHDPLEFVTDFFNVTAETEDDWSIIVNRDKTVTIIDKKGAYDPDVREAIRSLCYDSARAQRSHMEVSWTS